MGIENVQLLSDKKPVEEHHVVIVGRMGGYRGSNIYLVGPGRRMNAIKTGEEAFRRERKLATSVAIISNIAFSGDEEACRAFVERLEEKFKTREL